MSVKNLIKLRTLNAKKINSIAFLNTMKKRLRGVIFIIKITTLGQITIRFLQERYLSAFTKSHLPYFLIHRKNIRLPFVN